LNKSLLNYILNGTIILFLILVVYFSFSLINNSIKSEKGVRDISDSAKNLTNQPNLLIQLDVQNGTRENGVASKLTEYLRKNGMDVVEMGNFKSKDVERTTIIDRTGDKNKALKVAQVLGLDSRNVIQQLNSSLYLDVTVIIGNDFNELKPFAGIKK